MRASAKLPIEYPSGDGLPIAENTLQYRYITTIKGGIHAQYRGREDVFVAGDLFWYPVEGEPRIRMAPDAMVAFGRPPGERASYLQFDEEDISPQVVFEILSPSNHRPEMRKKLAFYDKYGVEEYYEYDPDRNIFRGWRRVKHALQPIPDIEKGYVSPRLGVRFEVGEELTVYGANGRAFVDYPELEAQREQESERAREADQRADKEARLAASERRRTEKAQRLAEQLEAEKNLAVQRAGEEAKRADAEANRADEAVKQADDFRRQLELLRGRIENS